MRTVLLQIINQHVIVNLDSLEMHLLCVRQYEVSTNTHWIGNIKTICARNYVNIFIFTLSAQDELIDVCNPSPCGLNSHCKVINNQPVCSCLSNYIGAPPNCKPECVVNSDCKTNRACVNNRCVNPCPRPCGSNSECKVINHSPVCSCRQGYTGDPFISCTRKLRECLL